MAAMMSTVLTESLSEEGGRYRAPIDKCTSLLQAIIGLFFFSRAYE